MCPESCVWCAIRGKIRVVSLMDTDASLQRLRREPPAFRRVRVRSTHPLSDRMLRVVLGGDELDGFVLEAPASSVRLLLPPSGHDAIELPTWTGNQFELASGERAPIRTFTPRRVDTERLELTLDIVLHDHGAATDWARRARVGDEVAVSGPGRSEPLDADAQSFLLVGDESALPAVCQLLEWIDPDRTVDVHIEITDPSARFDLTAHPGATVTWHHAESGAAPGAAMMRAVEDLDVLADAIWVAGEAAAVQRLRTHLFDTRGRSRGSVTARGYWKQGRSAT
jgi:NADPH-dependent ferric siderophore reductase